MGIERNGRFKRVQVKGTDRHEGCGYSCLLTNRGKGYTAKEIDYFAIYILDYDTWYIFPAGRLAGQGSVMLCPDWEKSLHWRYKEAWGLLEGRKRVAGGAVAGAGKISDPRAKARPGIGEDWESK